MILIPMTKNLSIIILVSLFQYFSDVMLITLSYQYQKLTWMLRMFAAITEEQISLHESETVILCSLNVVVS